MTSTRALLLLMTLILSGCATTSAVMLESNVTYPPTQNVQILTQAPTRPFKQIAMLEARGPVNTPITDLLESMRHKASVIGADAVIPSQDASTTQPQGVMFNPWLGGYQTIGGGTLPVIRGFAIKYTD
ncbi:MAG: hypothetical protein WA081_21610 [Desulfosalsimonadaceae bacterium]